MCLPDTADQRGPKGKWRPGAREPHSALSYSAHSQSPRNRW